MTLWTWWRGGRPLACPECGRTRFLLRGAEYEIDGGLGRRERALLAVCAAVRCGARVRIEAGTVRIESVAPPVRPREPERERQPRSVPDADLLFRRE